MAKQRFKENKNKKREPVRVSKHLVWGFRWWILYQSRTNKRRKSNIENLNKTKNIKLTFKNRKQLEKYLRKNNILN